MRRAHTITSSAGGQRAFSLVEMVMVMVLLGILSLIAVPRYATFLREQRLNAAELRIRSDIAMAQRRARCLGTTQTMTFSTLSHSYFITGMADPDRVAATYTVKLADDPYGVSLVTADLGGDSVVTFDGHGSADSQGTIVIRLGTQIRTITFGTSSIPWLVFEPMDDVPALEAL